MPPGNEPFEVEIAGVDRIVLHRYNTEHDRLEYLIKWKDERTSFSWEPEDQSVGAEKLIYEYWMDPCTFNRRAAVKDMQTTECVETHKRKTLDSALHEKGTAHVSLPLVCTAPQKRPRTKSDAHTAFGATMDAGTMERTKTGRKESHVSCTPLSFPETKAATNDSLRIIRVHGASSPRIAPYSVDILREVSLHILEQMRSCEPDKDRWDAINPADYRAAALFSMLIGNIVCRYDLGAYPYGIYGPPLPGMIVNVE